MNKITLPIELGFKSDRKFNGNKKNKNKKHLFPIFKMNKNGEKNDFSN